MLNTVRHMKDLAIHASNGNIGKVEEFYFDDETWAIRYLVVNTGDWLSGRRVLISPVFLKDADWGTKRLNVALTRQQIEKSPDIDTSKPVSRQHEAEYMDYYGASYYWGGAYIWGSGLFPAGLAGAMIPGDAQTLAADRKKADSHLRSTSAITGYHIQAADGEIGHVEDFIVDQDTWSVRYLEVDTRNWLPGKKVLISPQWIKEINWLESTIGIDLPKEVIKSAPDYLESKYITREYENQLHEYYDRQPYWVRETGHARLQRT